MIKRHREQRSVTRESKKSHHKHEKITTDKNLERNANTFQIHGIKRSVSHSWEGENHKITKHKHQGRNNQNIEAQTRMKPPQVPVNETNNEIMYQQGVSYFLAKKKLVPVWLLIHS